MVLLTAPTPPPNGASHARQPETEQQQCPRFRNGRPRRRHVGTRRCPKWEDHVVDRGSRRYRRHRKVERRDLKDERVVRAVARDRTIRICERAAGGWRSDDEVCRASRSTENVQQERAASASRQEPACRRASPGRERAVSGYGNLLTRARAQGARDIARDPGDVKGEITQELPNIRRIHEQVLQGDMDSAGTGGEGHCGVDRLTPERRAGRRVKSDDRRVGRRRE